MEVVLDQLNFEPGFVFTKDVTYVQFLDRVGEEERALRSAGVWEVPHPWLNLFVPRSRILDFDTGVFKGLLRDANPAGVILMYPMNKDRWDDRMTAMTPTADEDVFYAVSLLWSALSADDVEQLEKMNELVLDLCARTGMECKQYLPHHTSQDGWLRHFGVKWNKRRSMIPKQYYHRDKGCSHRWQRQLAVQFHNQSSCIPKAKKYFRMSDVHGKSF